MGTRHRTGEFAFPQRLYPIIDTLGDPGCRHVELAEAIVAGGAALVQLRIKDLPTGEIVDVARAVKGVTDRAGARLIINDRVDVAKLVGAAGVHLGQDDLPVAAARSLLGPTAIIGFSTHNLDQVTAATRAAVADYIGFGPIFPTTSKERLDPLQGLAGLRHIRPHIRLPIVAIGGITEAQAAEVLATGADAVAMIGAIVRAADATAAVRGLLARMAATAGP